MVVILPMLQVFLAEDPETEYLFCGTPSGSIASAFRKLPSIYVFSYFPFGFEGRMWDLIVSVPDHCLSFYTETCLLFGSDLVCLWLDLFRVIFNMTLLGWLIRLMFL